MRRPCSVLRVIAITVWLPAVAIAEQAPDKSTVALVGDAERFNIGQSGYCGKRTEIEQPSHVQFDIPARLRTYFFVRSTIKDQFGIHFCEGDFSFAPVPKYLHIIRYSMVENQCRLEMFSSLPGGTPERMQFEKELRRSCLLQ